MRESADRHRFVVTVHHIVCDGWSSSVLFSDLGRLYAADCFGIPAQLGPAASFREYVAGLTGPDHVAAATSDEEYWAARYPDGAPVLDLPLAKSRPVTKTYGSGREHLRIDSELYAELRQVGAAGGATLFATLLAAFEVLVHRLSGQSDFVVGIPLAGQLGLANSSLVAHCVSTVPLRARIDPEAPFVEHLGNVRQELARAQDHSRVTFGTMVRRLRTPRDPSRTPLVPMTFTTDKIGAPFDFGHVAIASVSAPKSYSNFELAINLVDSGSEIVVECDYNSDLFDGPTLRRWLSHYETLLRAVVARAESPVEALPVLNEADKRMVLDEWNDTDVAFPDEKRLHRLFEAQVRRSPDAQAVVDGTERVSYRELNARANRLAHRLRRAGIGPGLTVGVCLERRAHLVVALFAVLKAGGAYIPLDPAYPKQRVAYMLEDSRAQAVVTQVDLAPAFDASGVEQIVVDADGESIASECSTDLEEGATNTDLAYVIYTSGSTGKPKGVAIEHRSAGTLVHWARTVFSDHEISGVLASTSVCFDLSVFEIFFPLAFGGRVVLADHALDIASIPARNDVTLVNTVPSAVAEIVRARSMPPSVETVCLAGEPLPTRLVDQIYETTQAQRVFDLYGPSEDTTYSTVVLREPGARATIGHPISNTRAYVLDARREPVPIGAVGELYLAGDGLARGYLYRDELTAERFVSGTFGGRPVERAYRTGDLARYRPDGALEFLGRTDHQVKLRGFRIELGEIEAALTKHEEIQDAVVVVREDRPDDKRLVAYIVPRSDATGLVDRLRSGLRDKLPGYMVPAHFVVLAALPQTPNGKLDRGALPSPDVDAMVAGPRHIAPRTPTEARIAAMWADELGIESPSVEDDFFDVGGDSLKAAHIAATLRSEFRVDVYMRHLFERSTIAGLAQIVEGLANPLPEGPGSAESHPPARTQAPPPGADRNGWQLLRSRSPTAEPVYLQTAADPVFGLLHAAAGTPSATGVVLCAPWGWDEVASYRSRRAWAEHLARAGHPTLRFDLPATGDSGGSPGDPRRVDAWSDAIAAACDWLRANGGCQRVAVVGLGLSGLIACRALAGGARIEDVVLWAAPSRGRSFVLEQRAFSRLNTSHSLLTGDSPPVGLPEGWLEVGGFVLSAETVGALEDLDATTMSPLGLQRALLLDRAGARVDPDLRARFEEAGVAVAVASGNGWEGMVDHPQQPRPPLEVFDRVSSWLAEAPQRGPRLSPAPAGSSEIRQAVLNVDGVKISESPVVLDSPSGRIFGLLSEPPGENTSPLCVVFLNAGAVRRIGPNRLWTEASRRWAARGVPTMRFDLEGMGDSDGDGRRYQDDDAFYVQTLVDQVLCALDELEARGLGRRFVLIGLCSGGYWAFQAAIRDARVAAALLINAGALVWKPDLFARREVSREVEKLARLREFAWWTHMLRGKVKVDSMRPVLRALAIRASEAAGAPARRRSEDTAAGPWVDQALDRLRDAGTRIVMAFTEDDDLHAELARTGVLARLPRWPNVTLERLPGQDHTLRPLVVQQAFHDLLDRELERELERAGGLIAPKPVALRAVEGGRP